MTLRLKSGFEVAKFSDLDYEGMTVEVRFEGTPIAQLNRDKGPNNLEIVIPTRFSPDGELFTFELGAFLEALVRAKELLATLD